MRIHVVAPGETLWSIAQRYGVSLEALNAVNQVPNPDNLVVGQALVIPVETRYYVVRRGDTPWGIARRFNIPVSLLLSANEITDQRQITPGQRLVIPPGTRPTIEANVYIEPTGRAADRADVASVAPFVTYVALFSYHVSATGELTLLNDQQARDAAQQGNAARIMVITNIQADTFSGEVAQAILGSQETQDRLLTRILEVMRERGFTSLNIDFEHLRPADRESYNEFLRRVAQRMHEAGFTLSTALAPKVSAAQTGAWYEAHDYRAHGQIADFVVLMTYEWGWSGGPPLAVAPLPEVERVIRYALTEMDANKIMMGIPLYGYDWTLPYVQGGPFAKAISPQEAIRLAARYGATIQFDEASQSPFFQYWDEAQKEHIVWFEDARSIRAKFDLVKRTGIRGVSYWRLPLQFPQNWALLNSDFQVRKVT